MVRKTSHNPILNPSDRPDPTVPVKDLRLDDEHVTTKDMPGASHQRYCDVTRTRNRYMDHPIQ